MDATNAFVLDGSITMVWGLGSGASTTKPTPMPRRSWTTCRIRWLTSLPSGPSKWKAPGFHGNTQDLKTGRWFAVYGKDCDIPGCHCDAWIEEIPDPPSGTPPPSFFFSRFTTIELNLI